MQREGSRSSLWVAWPIVLGAVAATLVLPTTVGAKGDDEYIVLFLVAALALFLAEPVHVLAHELGHLAAAVVLRLRPRALHLYGVRLTRRPGALMSTATAAVFVDARAGDRALRLRMALVHAAGPAVNIGLTVLAHSIGSDPQHNASVRVAAGAAGVLGVATTLTNVLPLRLSDSDNDGLAILRWMFAPEPKREETFSRPRRRGPDLRGRARFSNEATPNARSTRDDLRRVIEEGSPEQAGAAATALLRSYAAGTRDDRTRALWREAPLLIRVGQRPDVAPEDVRYCCSSLAVVLALECVRGIVEAERAPTEDEVTTVTGLAEAGLAVLPTDPEAVHALAFARHLQGRSAETRQLLVGFPVEDGPSRVVARALAIRGLAEIDLDDRDQAERLVAQAEQLDPVQYVVHLARTRLNATS